MSAMKFLAFVQSHNWKLFNFCQYICFNRLCDQRDKGEVEIINCSDKENCLTATCNVIKKERCVMSICVVKKKMRALWVNLLQGEQIGERALPELLINCDISHKALPFFNMIHSAADFPHPPYFLTSQHSLRI